MGFSFDSRVRYSETGEDRKLTLNGILNYFQDCCTFHSESAGVGMDYLEKRPGLGAFFLADHSEKISGFV